MKLSKQQDFRRRCMVAVLWWYMKNQTKRQDCCHSGSSIYLTQESRSSLCILTNGTLFQQCSWLQSFAHWPPTRLINGCTIPWSLWRFQVDHQPSQRWIWGPSWRPHTLSPAAIQLANTFEGFYISHVSCLQNTNADALAALAATLVLLADTNYHLTVASHHLFCLKYSLEVSEVQTTSTNFEPRDWRFPIIDYALHGIFPMILGKRCLFDEGLLDSTTMQWKKYYCCSYDGILLRCLSNSESQEVIKEAHDGICGAHQPSPKLKDWLHRLGYYWPTMIVDAVKYA